jgi:hypothetical protein
MADSRTDSTTTQVYDSPWKDILEQFFPQFIAFFFPQVYEAIDWQRGHTFLDKEFQKITRTAQAGRKHVDKLVQVYLSNGQETWVLIHIEVQGNKETDFTERMFVYYYRIFDKFQRPLASLAVLSDNQANWRPSQFSQALFGCRITLDFPMVKLLDYEEKLDQLGHDPNPFALVVMAHLQSLQTKGRSSERYAAKLDLAKLLYQRGHTKKEILRLFHFIDWVMTLSHELDEQFQVELLQFEQEVNMQYVSTIERRATKKGIEQGIEQGIELGKVESTRENVVAVLTARFGTVPLAMTARLNAIQDIERLRQLLQQAATVSSLSAYLELLLADVGSDEASSTAPTNGSS